MTAKRGKPANAITNRRARYDYELGDSLVVGMELTGAETKALRAGQGQLNGAFVNVRGGELWLVNAQINPLPGAPIHESDRVRTRKLLAKKKQIEEFMAANTQGRTIVPLKILNRGRYIKLKIAVGRGRKRYDKRETLKRRQQQRDIERLSG